MALTRITKGVIKPNENYDTHNINSTGIVTAIGLDINGNGDISGNLSVGGVLTYEDVTSIDSVGIITARDGIDCNGDIDVDGHTNLDNVSIAGVTTFASSIHLADSIIHQGDTDTKIEFATNQIKLTANNQLKIDLTNDFTYIRGTGISEATSTYPKRSGSTYVHRFRDTQGDDTEVQFFNTNSKNTILSWNDTGNSTTAGNLVFKGAAGGSGLEHARFTGSGNFNLLRDLDVDGHTNLDNVNIAGVTTTTGNIHLNTGAKVGFVTDSNTFIGQDNLDRLDFNAGGKRLVSIVEGTNLPALLVDDSGVNPGQGNQGSGYNANANANDIVVGNISSGNHGMTIVSPSSGYGNIQFSDGSGGGNDATRGSIIFTHSDNKLNLKSKIGSIALTHKDDEKLVTTDAGISIPKDLDVDGHTNLDNVSIAGVTTFTGRSDHSSSLQMLAGNNIVLQNDANSANCQIDCYGGAGFRLTSYNQTMFTCENGSNTKFYTDSGTSRLEITHAGDVLVNTGGLHIPDALTHIGDTDTKIRFPAADTITAETGGNERFRIDSNGYIGIDYATPYNGLTINKEGDYWDNNGNTYAHPEGRVLSTWGGDRNDDTDYWVGFVGKYLKPSATVNILLQPHVGNFNNQAGMYIAGEATGNFSSDFTLGAISSGNVAGRGTTASSGKRATKSELLRIKPDGRLILGANTNHSRTINSHVPKLQVTGTNYSHSTISIINNANDNNGSYIFLGKQRSGAVGGNTAVNANDIIGELRFPVADGTDMNNYAAQIQVRAQLDATSNNTPGYIDFYTTRQNGSSEHKMRMTQNSNHSHLFSMGTGTSHLNNCTTPDRTSVKIGGLLHLEGPTGHNATPGMYYNCYSGGNDLFYRGTGAPSGGDRRPAAYGQKFGGHYFYGDNSSTAWSAQQQITSMQLNMNISSQGYVTKPQTPAFFATHTSASSTIIGTLTYNTSGNGYYNNGGHLDVSTGKFTAPCNGIYHFHFHGFFQSGQNNNYYEVIMIRRNSNGGGALGLTRQYGYRDQATNQYGPSISMQCTCSLTAGQTVEVSTGGLSFHGANGWYFGGHLLG